MEKKKVEFGTAFADAGKSAAKFLGKTKDAVVKAIDQNDDGTLDLKDVSDFAGTVSETAKQAATSFKGSVVAKSLEIERKALQPIFDEDLDSADFLLTKLIRIAEIDKRHAESEVCKNSIGYMSSEKDLAIVNIFRDKVDSFNLSFYPDLDSEFYYVDPCDRDHYIALDRYFDYLKIVRVNELQRIAQDLGAKHFRVLYKEHISSSTDSAAKGKMLFKPATVKLSGDGEHSVHTSDTLSAEIAAENIFPGHGPMQPELHYLQREPAILNLIKMRMNETSPTQHESFSFSLINSSGMKEKDAVKIDAALKSMKLSGDTTVASEIRNEAKRFFKFEVDF